ncbi:MAG: hypothetical protein ABUS57_18875 [Pseudomonadota bacterium]
MPAAGAACAWQTRRRRNARRAAWRRG